MKNRAKLTIVISCFRPNSKTFFNLKILSRLYKKRYINLIYLFNGTNDKKLIKKAKYLFQDDYNKIFFNNSVNEPPADVYFKLTNFVKTKYLMYLANDDLISYDGAVSLIEQINSVDPDIFHQNVYSNNSYSFNSKSLTAHKGNNFYNKLNSILVFSAGCQSGFGFKKKLFDELNDQSWHGYLYPHIRIFLTSYNTISIFQISNPILIDQGSTTLSRLISRASFCDDYGYRERLDVASKVNLISSWRYKYNLIYWILEIYKNVMLNNTIEVKKLKKSLINNKLPLWTLKFYKFFFLFKFLVFFYSFII